MKPNKSLAGLFFTLLIYTNSFSFQKTAPTLVIVPFESEIKSSQSLTIDKTQLTASLGDSIVAGIRSSGQYQSVQIAPISEDRGFNSRICFDQNEQFVMKLPNEKTNIVFKEIKADFVLLLQDISIISSKPDSNNSSFLSIEKMEAALWDNKKGTPVWTRKINLKKPNTSWENQVSEIISVVTNKAKIEAHFSQVANDEFQDKLRFRIFVGGQMNFHFAFQEKENQNIPAQYRNTEENPAISDYFDNSFAFTPSIELMLGKNFSIGGEYNKETMKGSKNIGPQFTYNSRNYNPIEETLVIESKAIMLTYYFEPSTYGVAGFIRGRFSSRTYTSTSRYEFATFDVEFSDVTSPGLSAGFYQQIGVSHFGISGEAGLDFGSTKLEALKYQGQTITTPTGKSDLGDNRFFLKAGLTYDIGIN